MGRDYIQTKGSGAVSRRGGVGAGGRVPRSVLVNGKRGEGGGFHGIGETGAQPAHARRGGRGAGQVRTAEVLVAGDLPHRFTVHYRGEGGHDPDHDDDDGRLQPPRLGEQVRELRHARPRNVINQQRDPGEVRDVLAAEVRGRRLLFLHKAFASRERLGGLHATNVVLGSGVRGRLLGPRGRDLAWGLRGGKQPRAVRHWPWKAARVTSILVHAEQFVASLLREPAEVLEIEAT